MTPAATKQFFLDKLNLTDRVLERALAEALSAGGDYADLYFEYITSSSLSVDESLVKSASQGVSAGCGVRVLSGERTGYAYTDDLSAEALTRAARTATLIAKGPSKQPIFNVAGTGATRPDLYPIAGAEIDAEVAAKLDLVMRADRAARGYDPRITQVRAGYSDELRRILICGSDGTFATDTQPLARFSVFVLAKDAQESSRGTSGGGGRFGLEAF